MVFCHSPKREQQVGHLGQILPGRDIPLTLLDKKVGHVSGAGSDLVWWPLLLHPCKTGSNWLDWNDTNYQCHCVVLQQNS